MVDITAAMQGVAQAIVEFANFGITIVAVLFVWQVIMFIRGPDAGASAEERLGAAAKKIKNVKRGGRQLRRAIQRVYRIDKGDLPKILNKVEKDITAKTISKKLPKILKDGREELEREGELLTLIDDLTQKLGEVADATRKGKIKKNLDVLETLALKNFDDLKKAYTAMEKALGKTPTGWTDAQTNVDLCRDKLADLSKDLVGLEAVHKQLTA